MRVNAFYLIFTDMCGSVTLLKFIYKTVKHIWRSRRVIIRYSRRMFLVHLLVSWFH